MSTGYLKGRPKNVRTGTIHETFNSKVLQGHWGYDIPCTIGFCRLRVINFIPPLVRDLFPPLFIPFVACHNDMLDSNTPDFAELDLNLFDAPGYCGNGCEAVFDRVLAAVDLEVAMAKMNPNVLS